MEGSISRSGVASMSQCEIEDPGIDRIGCVEAQPTRPGRRRAERRDRQRRVPWTSALQPGAAARAKARTPRPAAHASRSSLHRRRRSRGARRRPARRSCEWPCFVAGAARDVVELPSAPRSTRMRGLEATLEVETAAAARELERSQAGGRSRRARWRAARGSERWSCARVGLPVSSPVVGIDEGADARDRRDRGVVGPTASSSLPRVVVRESRQREGFPRPWSFRPRLPRSWCFLQRRSRSRGE